MLMNLHKSKWQDHFQLPISKNANRKILSQLTTWSSSPRTTKTTLMMNQN